MLHTHSTTDRAATHETARRELERQAIHRQSLHGAFDVIGDVHGCFEELCDLLRQLGYTVSFETGQFHLTAVEGRKLVFVGDLVDRGPQTPNVLRFVSQMVASGQALCVPGNHDIRLMKALRGKAMPLTFGLAESLEQMALEPPEFKTQAADFLDSLPSHLLLDDGKLVVAHAGLPEAMQGGVTHTVRDVATHGQKTGETDEFGDVRYVWAADYRGDALVIYGHTPVAEPLWMNNTVNIDTGCVYGGKLTALRYPERETVSVSAQRRYFQNTRPFLPDDPHPHRKPKRTPQL